MSGSDPDGTEAHVPGDPASAQETHVPEQAVEQQTNCAHWPELHSGPVVQGEPTDSLPQLMLMQLFGATQSAAAVVQLSLQAVADAHW